MIKSGKVDLSQRVAYGDAFRTIGESLKVYVVPDRVVATLSPFESKQRILILFRYDANRMMN